MIYLISNISNILPSMENFQKLYLGSNYLTYQRLEKQGFQSIVQHTSKNLSRVEDFVTNIDNYFHNDLLMTLTDTCSSNKYLSPLFEFVLKGLCILDMTKSNENILLFVDTADDVSLYKNFLCKNGGNCRVFEPTSLKIKNGIRTIRNNVLEMMGTLFKLIYLKWYRMIKVKNQDSPQQPLIYLISWVNPHSFEKDAFWSQNNYFGYLPEFLKQKTSVQVVSKVLFGSLTYKETIMNALKYDSNIRFLEEYLSILDLIHAFLKAFNIFKYISKKYMKNGVDISPFLKRSLIKDLNQSKHLNAIINFYAFQKLLKNIPEGSKIIYPFENQPWERALNLSSKLVKKNLICIAYQFFPIPKNLLIHKFSRLQIERKLNPNIILTSDYNTEKLFHEQNIQTRQVGSFRFSKLLQSTPNFGMNFENKTILCSLSIDSKEAIELAEKAVGASKDSHYSLWINFHPLLPSDTKRIISEKVKTVDRVVIKDLPASQLISEVSLVMYNSSSVCYEAILQGIPAIYVESELEVNLNRFSGKIKTYQKPADGKKIIQELLQDKSSYIEYSKSLYEDAVKNVYKVNTEEMEKLIP